MSDLFAKVAAMQAKTAQAKLDKEEAEAKRLLVREQKRLELRQSMPHIAELVDLLRDSFGNGVRVTYAEENGQVIGRR